MILTPPMLLAQPLMMHEPFVTSLIDEAVRMMIAPGSQPRQSVGDGVPQVRVALYDDSGQQLLPQVIEGPDGQMRETEVSTEDREPHSLIAVVSLSGVMTRHGYSGWWSSAPGTAQIGRMLQKMDADSAIHTIVLAVNSPGGAVSGTPELADIVFQIRENNQTTIMAAVDDLMASAAIYVGTAADKVYSIPSAYVGSIGTVMSYTSYVEALEKAGISVDFVRTPAKKARFTGVEALTDEMRETMTDRIAASQKWFVAAMAKHRDVSEKYVNTAFGQGEVMRADEAVEVRLIDGLMSLDEIVLQQATIIREGRAKSRRANMKQRLDDALQRQQQLQAEIDPESVEADDEASTETADESEEMTVKT